MSHNATGTAISHRAAVRIHTRMCPLWAAFRRRLMFISFLIGGSGLTMKGPVQSEERSCSVGRADQHCGVASRSPVPGGQVIDSDNHDVQLEVERLSRMSMVERRSLGRNGFVMNA